MRFFKSPKVNMFLPYLLLAAAVIVIYRIVLQISVVFGALSWFLGVISPFIYGLLLAYVLNIPCSGLQKLFARVPWGFVSRKKKGFGILTVYLIFILFLVLVLNLIIPQISNSISFFTNNWANYYETAIQVLTSIGNYVEFDLQSLLPDNIPALLQGFQANNWFFGTMANVATGLVRGVLALVASIYFLIEKNSLKLYLQQIMKVFLPTSVSKPIFKYAGALNKNFKQYIYTQTIDGLICGAMATLVLFVIGSPYALVLGLIVGVFNYIPYFGSIIATLLAILVVGLTQGFTMALVAAAALLVIQQIDANLIQPKLMSGSFSLSPLLVIISVTVGGAFAGVLGMVAAIPIAAVLKDCLDSFMGYRMERDRSE